MTTQESIRNAMQWYKNKNIDCFQSPFPDNFDSVYVCANGYYVQITTAEIDYRSELYIHEYKKYNNETA